MNFSSYMKQELEKTLFIEIKDDLTLSIDGNPILKKGEYPILPDDLVHIAKENNDSITPSMLIDGMIYVIACDPAFKYTNNYVDFFKAAKGIESYIIMNINKFRKENLKKSVILASGLVLIAPKKEYKYNRILLLIELYEKTQFNFIEDEILSSLENIIVDYPNFTPPYFHLGKYYLDKKLDLSKVYLRKCLDDNKTKDEAARLLRQIENAEKFDDAVEYVKNGQGLEALKILIPICTNDPEDLDAKYYISVAYRQAGNNRKALMYLNELTNFAERPEVYAEIGLNLAQLDDFEGALEYLKKGLKITPDDTGILCNIGVCQLNLGKFEEGLKTFELVHRIDPEDDIATKWIEHITEDKK